MPATAPKKRWNPRSEDRQSAMHRLVDENRRGEFIARLRAEMPNGQHRSETGLLRCDDKLFYRLMKEFPPLPGASSEPSKAAATTVTDSWPFYITQEKAALQLVDGAVRDSNYDADVQWVGVNLGNAAATPKDAPSNAAWQMLLNASRNDANGKAFYKDHYRPVMERKAAGANDTVQRRSEVKVFDLIDQFEGWKHCPHCGGDLTGD